MPAKVTSMLKPTIAEHAGRDQVVALGVAVAQTGVVDLVDEARAKSIVWFGVGSTVMTQVSSTLSLLVSWQRLPAAA